MSLFYLFFVPVICHPHQSQPWCSPHTHSHKCAHVVPSFLLAKITHPPKSPPLLQNNVCSLQPRYQVFFFFSFSFFFFAHSGSLNICMNKLYSDSSWTWKFSSLNWEVSKIEPYLGFWRYEREASWTGRSIGNMCALVGGATVKCNSGKPLRNLLRSYSRSHLTDQSKPAEFPITGVTLIPCYLHIKTWRVLFVWERAVLISSNVRIGLLMNTEKQKLFTSFALNYCFLPWLQNYT